MRNRNFWIVALVGLLALLVVVVVTGKAAAVEVTRVSVGPDRSVGRNVSFRLEPKITVVDDGVDESYVIHWAMATGPDWPSDWDVYNSGVTDIRIATPGTYVFKVWTTEDDGHQAQDDITITVTPAGRLHHPHHHNDGAEWFEYVRHSRDTLEKCIKHKHQHVVARNGEAVLVVRRFVPHGCAS